MAAAAAVAASVSKIWFGVDFDCTLTDAQTSGSESYKLRTDAMLKAIRAGHTVLISDEAIKFLNLALAKGHDVAIVSFSSDRTSLEMGVYGGADYIRAVLLASGLGEKDLERITIIAERQSKACRNKNAHIAKALDGHDVASYTAKYLIDDDHKNREGLPEGFIALDPMPYDDERRAYKTQAEFWSSMNAEFFGVPVYKGPFKLAAAKPVFTPEPMPA